MSKQKRKSDDGDCEASTSKIMKRVTKANPSWFKEFKCLEMSEKGDLFVYCKLCKCDFSVRSSGKYDTKKHMMTQKHKLCVKAVEDTHQDGKKEGLFQYGITTYKKGDIVYLFL